MHLKPEGLGDIVIHIAGTDGKMSVRIGVTSPGDRKACYQPDGKPEGYAEAAEHGSGGSVP